MAEFLSLFDMGKHTVYVWSCYAFVTICLLGLIVSLIAEGRNLKRAMKAEGLE
ncbi:heme exporter protein CcmD [Ignatzschineria indica]|uniref:heme exporter protein CcmD n=1 Tax=Ignatzschineria indica TaxID=472583 RepID=UPI0025766DA0|nr:heme exporter protein CcmD [Ignatzschineria indica]MDM1545765.1 heme exporter protein CcmD [Ignatzschineria indica]